MSRPNPQPLLSVQGLTVGFGSEAPAVAGVSFDVDPGEILGLVGESGSGKSVTCRALMGLLPKIATVSGALRFDERQMPFDPAGLADLRGQGMSMIFQDPMSALDPLMTVRRHMALRTQDDPLPILRQAGLQDPRVLEAYPHQMSGGQCQRVAMACALAKTPRLLIADEPTTALDVTVQAEILDALRALVSERGMGLIFVTHDLAVVSRLCQRVLVMHRGKIVENGPVGQVLTAPGHAYTRDLIAAIPKPRSRPPPPAGPAILRFDAISVRYQPRASAAVQAVKDVSLTLHRGEILGLVGESGSGKSTLAKTAVGLATPASGQVWLEETPLDWHRPQMVWRRRVQYIFQDPRGALDPIARLARQVRLPLDVHKRPGNRMALAEARMAETGLHPSLYQRKPAGLSGGQRQRATIARALTLEPEVLICDESVSALDVQIQARVLRLLTDLRAKRGIAILFISHDLSVIRHLCDRVAVMQAGEIVETGDTEAVFATPRHPYTARLVEAIPSLAGAAA